MKKGYIIKSFDFASTSKVVSILNEDGTIKTAIVKGVRRKNFHSTCDVGNLVNFEHYGREDSLGVFAIECLQNSVLENIDDYKVVIYILASCDIIANLIPEKSDNLHKIYHAFESIVILVNNYKGKSKDNDFFIKIAILFINLESIILKEFGYHYELLSHNLQTWNECHNQILTSYKNLMRSLSLSDIKISLNARAELNNITNKF
jgi:recombinational DNA repair protein (RecF pathway)